MTFSRKAVSKTTNDKWTKVKDAFRQSNNRIIVSDGTQFHEGQGLKYKLNHPVLEAGAEYSPGDIVKAPVDLNFRLVVDMFSGIADENFMIEKESEFSSAYSGSLMFKLIEEFQYGIINSINNNTLIMEGVALNAEIEELYVCDQSGVKDVIYELSDDVWTVGNHKEITEGNIPFEAPTGKLVNLRTWCKTQDTGTATGGEKAHVQIMSSYDMVVKDYAQVGFKGIPFTTETFESSGIAISPTGYKFNYNQIPNIYIYEPGGNNDTVRARIKLTFIVY